MQLLDDGAKKGKVMKELLMMKGAKVLVDVATKVQAGETVLLVTDYAKTDIAQAVAAVACDRGAEVMIMSMKPRKRGFSPPTPSSKEISSKARFRVSSIWATSSAPRV